MNGIDEGRKNIEKINFAMQEMAESGSFWNPYLIFYDAYEKPLRVRRRLMGNDLWYNITVAYWTLVLFGFQSCLSRRLFEGLIGYYQGSQKSTHEEWYEHIKQIAREDRLTDIMVRKMWASSYDKKF